MLRAAALGVQTQQTVAKLPIWNLALAMQQARDMALNSVDRSSDLRLCQAGFHEFGDDLFPHVTIIMILFPSVNISAGILSKIYQESVDIGKHNPDNDYIATTTQGNEMAQVKFMKHYVTDGAIKARVFYSLDNRADCRKVVTIYAKDYSDNLAAVLPDSYENLTDIYSDYFDKGTVRLFESHPLYAAARQRAEANLTARH